METRVFKGLDKPVSLLGFGCMRFPEDESGRIDEVVAENMLLKAYESGVNYFDTAYPYHDKESEPFIGKVLGKLERDTYFLTTKLPCWEINSLDEAKAMFKNQLERLDKEYLDCYLLHAMSEERFQKMEKLGVIDYVFELKKEGLVRNVGFSFHDSFKVFEKWIRAYPWDVVQIQLNYMDVENQAGIKGYGLATELDIPVIVMEPVRGGSLANLPEQLMTELSKFDASASQASWALRYVASLQNVKVVLSGMSTMDQLDDNLSTFNSFKPLRDVEVFEIHKVRDELNKRVFNACTGCGYCMPCPAGVDIPGNFRIWNEYGKFKNVTQANWEWKLDMNSNERGSSCIGCGKCETVCPQHIEIRENLKSAVKLLDSL